jgi:RimJ/RimL family protein N-acetyltransferase
MDFDLDFFLTPITANGSPEADLEDLPLWAKEILAQTADLYRASSYHPPWIGYLAASEQKCIGFCAFKAPPEANAVEIAYAVMPEFEGRGVATQMARRLISIAREHTPNIIIRAQTLPQENTSTAILKKTGFRLIGEVMHEEDGLVWEWRLNPQNAT